MRHVISVVTVRNGLPLDTESSRCFFVTAPRTPSRRLHGKFKTSRRYRCLISDPSVAMVAKRKTWEYQIL